MAEWIQLKLNKMTAFNNFIHILTDEIQRKFVKNVEVEIRCRSHLYFKFRKGYYAYTG